jgi:pimeloyl-ACP methyl ester carboxylesterase
VRKRRRAQDPDGPLEINQHRPGSKPDQTSREPNMQRQFLIDGLKIDAAWYGPRPDVAPTLILLHEGLGCVQMWRDFPRRLAERSGFGVLVYSRPGYGRSDPVPLPRSLGYMHQEALDVLPAILDQAEIRKAILLGHSDGASIATIYAGSRQDFRIRGLVLIAPHFFVEETGLQAIQAATAAYQLGDLRQRLGRYHGSNVDVAFWGWNRAWLDPAFRCWRIDENLAYIRVPILIIQGLKDQYGTAAQIETAEQEATCPVEVVMLAGAGHSPQLEEVDATLQAIKAFVDHVLVAHEGLRR